MSTEETFRTNVALLKRITPQVAIKLQWVDPSDLELCETRQGEPNLRRRSGDKIYYYHSRYSAEKEAEKWFANLDTTSTKVLYIYGVGLGYYYSATKKWLDEDPNHYLVFLEDDMAVLRRFMETELATEILENKQVQIHHFEDVETSQAMFHWVTWYFINLRPDVTSLDFYRRERSEETITVKRKILYDTVNKESLAAEFRRCGASFFRNYYSNLLHLPDSCHGNQLFGKFKDVPAIICGAGPSLNKNCDLLRELSDRALILTGGSALNALSSRGILPHFGGGIDPNPTQYERLMTNTAYEVPFFYRQRMFHKAFSAIHGPRLFVNGAGGYEISQYFEEALDIENEDVDEGLNVINFLIDIATHLGCNPIILTGMDLAYTGMQSYANGVVPDANVNEEAILETGDLETGAFPRPDVNGDPVYTLWKWVGEADWIGNYAQTHPEHTFINATEGGIGFPGVPNLPLETVLKEHLSVPRDLSARVHGEIQNATFEDLSAEKLMDAMDKMHDSLIRCEELCELLLKETARMEEKVKAGKKVPPGLQSGENALYDAELNATIAFKYILSGLTFVAGLVAERRTHQLKYDKTIRTDRDRNLELLRTNREKLTFLRTAAQINKELMSDAVTNFRKEGGDTGSYFKKQQEAETV